MASVANSAICGISIGTENCYVAVTRQGGIEILLNEYSQRSTPAYVGFGGNQREIGVAAKQKHMMNLRNTCFAPTSIIGKKFHQLNLKELPYNVEKGPDDEVFIRTTHNGEELCFTPTQLTAMLFTKLRQISGNAIDCVINCPNHFDFVQRQALMDAAQIAGLNPLRVVSDMTAISLYYGFYRNSSNGSDISVVGFVDCGQSTSQAAIVLFNHKENYLKVLDAQSIPDVGGKHFDEVLANHFIEKHKLNLNLRSRYRLIAECEKLKKNLSANPNELPINIECLYEERDFSDKIDRATFEKLAENLFDKIASMLKVNYKNALERYRKEYEENYGEFKIDSVEIVGGTSRIPFIKKIIKELSGLEPSTTLNADEAVARGCALQCAILSPTFKVARELHLIDSLSYDVDFKLVFDFISDYFFLLIFHFQISYQIHNKDLRRVPAIYPRGHPFPYAKQITINSDSLPIIISFDYQNLLNEKVCLSQYKISEQTGSNASQLILEHKSPIKIRIRVDHNCLISVSSATISYEKTPAEEESADNLQPAVNNENENKMDVDQPQNNDSQNNQEPIKKKKPKTITIDLSVEPMFLLGHLSKENKDQYIETECNLILADKNWKEKTDARNTLEEYIYEWRNRLESGQYDMFLDPAHRQAFISMLETNEKWLYEQDEQEIMHSKNVYEERTNSMTRDFSKAIINRKKEFENRARFLEQLGHNLQQGRKLMDFIDPEEEEEMRNFAKEIDEKQKWFDDVSGKLSKMSTYEDPKFTCDDINKQSTHILSMISNINDNRKRRAEERRKAAEKAEKEKQQQAGDGIDSQKNEQCSNKMEVDEELSNSKTATV
ncbi:hypothetical protein NH340_JMT01027 [Sarcoptes scabiei]|nr:hypothetical protein NH340_JMT01027 [Sarcoptes scabiei]